MPGPVRDTVIAALDDALPQLQGDFVMHGPLRGVLPADIRADVVQVFTQVLCRAIQEDDDRELTAFIENVVWESRKLGVTPSRFLAWIDRYSLLVRPLINEEGWAVAGPTLKTVRERIARLEN